MLFDCVAIEEEPHAALVRDVEALTVLVHELFKRGRVLDFENDLFVVLGRYLDVDEIVDVLGGIGVASLGHVDVIIDGGA